MPEPELPKLHPSIMFLMVPMTAWSLADNGVPPIHPFAVGMLMDLPIRLVGLPSDRDRLCPRPKESSLGIH